MYTQCPYCLTAFEPTPYQLSRGRGRLQCGVCSREFDALERLNAQPIHSAALPVPRGDEPPRVQPGVIPEQGSLFQPAQTEAPGFAARRSIAPVIRPSTRWWLGSLLLALVLGAQVVLAQRHELARDSAWRPWLERLCATLDCDLPAWSDRAALQLMARDVRPHPSVPNELMISASFRNDAPWPQAWPTLEISLADLDGKRLALRRFSATEYLGAKPRDRTLGPGQSVSATLEVQDPGKGAVAFAFDFR
jgi:hypothetical protein